MNRRSREVRTVLRRTITAAALLAFASVLIPSGAARAGTCPIELPQGGEPVTLDPGGFVELIDNPYWPMTPGTRWVYRETDAEGARQTIRVRVTAETRQILGITATVVHDVAREGGELLEDTLDWYAQDACGNVWYLGEDTKAYGAGGSVSTVGSWEAGVDGAQPGVIVPADPQVGATYRQEYYAGSAEDGATILSLDEQVEVPFGHFVDVMLTKEFTPLEPRLLEYKLYVIGVGPALALAISGGTDREVLVRFSVPA
jgi:hypothetical protein